MNHKQVRQEAQRFLASGLCSYIQMSFYDQGQWTNEELKTAEFTSLFIEAPFFDLASLTKVLGTAPVIFRLMEEGKLSLTTAVQSFLPIANKELTIQHLLTHTSDFHGFIPKRDSLPPEQLADALLTQMQVGPNLGKKVCYSDLNFIYLGWIAEVLLQKPIWQLIAEQLFPLAEGQFSFAPPVQQTIATQVNRTTKQAYSKVHDPKAKILQQHCGSAGLFGTLLGLQTLIEYYLQKNTNFLSLASYQALEKNYTAQAEGRSRSLAWVLEEGSQSLTFSHTGYTGTYLLWNAEKGKAFIFLCDRLTKGDDNAKYLQWRDQLIATYIEEEKL